MEASDIMSVAALGRPFTLGMLYDAQKDQLIPGFTLWDQTTIQKNTVESSQRSSDFKLYTSDSTETKSSLMDVEVSLKASFLCGLVEVGGSAKFMKDQKKFVNQSRVTCHYKATFNNKQLLMTNLGKLDENQISAIEKVSATHVVVGILYGANAFFVFDSEKLDSSKVQDVQVNMYAAANKIPLFTFETSVKTQLTDKEQSVIEKFSCKFHGDVVLKSNPTTFVEAVKAYADLPKLLGDNGENAVAMKVWLMPLKKLHSGAAELLSDLSVGLVKKVQDTLEDLGEMEIRCNDSLVDKVTESLPVIKKELQNFQNTCHLYKSNIQKTVQKKLLSIRQGKEDESSLNQLFVDNDKSPFTHDNLSKWMDCKEREINVTRSCLEVMEGIKIVPNKSELDREVLAGGVKHALCFVFTSLESPDPFLDALSKYLDSGNLGATYEDPWYYSGEVLTKMRDKARAFHDIASPLKNRKEFSFLVASIKNEKYTGATIYQFRDGILVTEDFSRPDIPKVENITDKRDLLWYTCDLTVDVDTLGRKLSLAEGNKKVVVGQENNYQNNPKRRLFRGSFISTERLHVMTLSIDREAESRLQPSVGAFE
ncbi:neoverrucotoxin subunit beta-like [Xenentodon cancila]